MSDGIDRATAAEPDASLTDGPETDASHAEACCVNFCRVTGTPEELILDFAMDCEAPFTPVRRLTAQRRITLSPTTAKRLVAALDSLLQQYESRFGAIEMDVQRRLVERRS